MAKLVRALDGDLVHVHRTYASLPEYDGPVVSLLIATSDRSQMALLTPEAAQKLLNVLEAALRSLGASAGLS